MHSWRIAAVASFSVAALAATSCSKAPDAPPAHSTETATKDAAKPSASTNPERNAYFGDLHLHTGYSADAALMTDSTPDDAYRYAKGEAIARFGNQTIQLKRPLDFLAVTDHAEYAGAVQELRREGGPLYDTELGKAFRSTDFDTRMKAYLSLVHDIARAGAAQAHPVGVDAVRGRGEETLPAREVHHVHRVRMDVDAGQQ
jgi:hypothetical protein